jgi:hypothetical protein
MTETVRIKDGGAEGGFRIIDKSEFIEGVHVLFEQPGAQPPAENTHLPEDFRGKLEELDALEEMKRPRLNIIAEHYRVKVSPGMSNVQVVSAIRAAAGYKQPDAPAGEGAEIKFVMMKRTTDGDGPHPIHPDEVENYRRGEWVEVEVEPKQ